MFHEGSFEGSLEVKLPTIWTDGKAEVWRVREEKKRSKKIRRAKIEETRDSLCFFQWFVAPEGRKVGSKAAGAEPSGQMRDENLHAGYGAKQVSKSMHTAHHSRTTCWSWDVQKVHAVVVRSTCPSQKCRKTDGYGALLDVQMSFCVEGARGLCTLWKVSKMWTLLAGSTTTTNTLHYTALQYTTLRYTNYITLHYVSLRYTPFH